MKILPLNNIKYYSNNVSFKSKYHQDDNIEDEFISNQDKEPKKEKPIPNWARKLMLASLIFFTFKNDPFVQNLFADNEISQEEMDRTEFFKDVQKMIKDNGISSSFYQLNMLADIETPKIKSMGNNTYSLSFNLDKQNVNLVMKLDSNNKDIIQGKIKVGKSDFVNYIARFQSDDKDRFSIILKDKDNKKFIFGREADGELYQVKNGKKCVLNSENTKKYEDYLKSRELYDDFRFFTNENDLWRKLNILLVIYLLYNEARYDKARRQEKNNKNQTDV